MCLEKELAMFVAICSELEKTQKNKEDYEETSKIILNVDEKVGLAQCPYVYMWALCLGPQPVLLETLSSV